jgi:hypothetical protein
MNPAEIQNVTSAQWAQMDSTVFKIFLGDGDYLYTVDVYGANNDIQSLDYYIMDKDEGNASYNTDLVSLTDYWQMITDYELVSVTETIDSGYLKSVDIDLDPFATVNSIDIPEDDFHVYSTEEQLVGYWINGKPIYERTIQNNSLSTTIDLSSYNIETVIKLDSIGCDTNTFVNGSPTSGSRWTISGVTSSNSKVNYINASNQYRREGQNYTGAIIIQYTKTTDPLPS